MEVKVNIQPIFVSYEEGFFRKLPTTDEINEHVNRVMKELTNNVSKEEANILQPIIITHPKEISELRKKLTYDVDMLLVYRVGGMAHKLIASIGLIGPPLVMIGRGVLNHDIVAYLKARGREAYAPVDYQEFNTLVKCFRVKKFFMNSRILIISSMALPSFSVISSIHDLELLRDKFGIDSILIPSEELFKEFNECLNLREVDDITRRIIENAKGVHTSEDNIRRCIALYVAIKRLLNKYYANAVTINCAEPMFYKHRVTPCIAFSLLKDEGIPASCEADLSVLLAMMILSYLSNKPAFMGNLWLHDKANNIVRISHDVPVIKMKGFSEEGYPYEIFDFHNQGYGASFYVHLDVNKVVTFARFHANADRILVSSGEIIDTHEGIACRQTLDIRVKKADQLIKKATEYGHHFALVYGDYINELEKLGEILKVRVEIV